MILTMRDVHINSNQDTLKKFSIIIIIIVIVIIIIFLFTERMRFYYDKKNKVLLIPIYSFF